MGDRTPKIAEGGYGTVLRAALQLHHEHPEITLRKDEHLRSINARLGALIGETQIGIDLPPLSTEWIEELLYFQMAELEAMERATSRTEE